MFDTLSSSTTEGGYLPPKLNFPTKFRNTNSLGKITLSFEGTLNVSSKTEHTQSKLFDDLKQVYTYAQHVYQDLDPNQLKIGYFEASILVSGRLFGEVLYPTVSIDPYGEFIFSHMSKMGYVDIGVSGEGELSYHVRNDVYPEETRFDDYNWEENDYKIPIDLYKALKSLEKHL